MGKTPKIVILDQELVREKLRQKKYDDVCLSSWGRLDEFIQFITSFGIFGSSRIIVKKSKAIHFLLDKADLT